MARLFSDPFLSDVVSAAFDGLIVHDGSGYPAGTLQPIPEAQILAVADVYDALTSSRPYRAGKSPADAIAIMKEEEQGRLEGDAVKALSSLVLN